MRGKNFIVMAFLSWGANLPFVHGIDVHEIAYLSLNPVGVSSVQSLMPSCLTPVTARLLHTSGEGQNNTVLVEKWRIEADPGCAWKSVSSEDWIQPYPLSGTGSRDLIIRIPPTTQRGNRRGTLNVSGFVIEFAQPGDKEAPPAPVNLHVVYFPQQGVTLTWGGPAMMDVISGLKEIFIYRDETEIGRQDGDSTIFTDNSLPSINNTVCYQLESADQAGNRSPRSEAVCVDLHQGSNIVYGHPKKDKKEDQHPWPGRDDRGSVSRETEESPNNGPVVKVTNAFVCPSKNNSGTIQFELFQSQAVRVEVYDRLGRTRIRTLVDEVKPSGGTYLASWNGRNEDGDAVAKGVYTAIVTIGDKVSTHKFAVVPMK